MRPNVTRFDPTARRRRSGFTIAELLVVIAVFFVGLSITLPALARGRGDSFVNVSLNNLITLGVTQVVYAADYGGRQMTVIDDDISAFGSDAISAFSSFNDGGNDHPSIKLGWGEFNGLVGNWAYSLNTAFSGNFPLALPISFDSPFSQFLGSFRMHNARVTYPYVGGRYYDPTFYPPNDPYVRAVTEPGFDEPWEWVFLDGVDDTFGQIPGWSSYCMSPAAMFHPDVFRAPPRGGWQDPWSIDHAFQSPGLFHAKYASLKTSIIEHNWNQSPPPPGCNPAFEPGTYGGCEPYFFNHGLASAPASLFYDLNVRLLPNGEVLAADEMMMNMTGYGLWSRDTSFGENGYLSEFSFDQTQLSHHVLTTEGILGRDTIAGASPQPR